MHRWLKKHGSKHAHIALEATGIYGELLAETMHQRSYAVSVINPARIKAYGDSRMQRNKTDQLDAALIADYCRTQQPPLWTPPKPEIKALRALVRHFEDLKEERQRAKNRLAATSATFVQTQLKAQILNPRQHQSGQRRTTHASHCCQTLQSDPGDICTPTGNTPPEGQANHKIWQG